MNYDRSAVMRAVKSRGTGPERAVCALLRPIAPGYRLHRADLPGKPDVVYAGRKLAIFVHGCFWHGHDCARGARAQDQRRLLAGQDRPQPRPRRQNLAEIAALGWRALVVYECELKDKTALAARLAVALAGRAWRALKEQASRLFSSKFFSKIRNRAIPPSSGHSTEGAQRNRERRKNGKMRRFASGMGLTLWKGSK